MSAFREHGILRLGNVLSPTQCCEIRDYLEKKYFVPRQQPHERFSQHNRPVEVKLGDYDLETVVNCPHIMELANSPALLQFATEHLEITPTISNIGIRWSFPVETPAGEVQFFHRDAEVGSNFKVLIYLTDVDADSGPHVYVQKTHHDRMPFLLRPYSEQQIDAAHNKKMIVTGPAGTAFAIDTKGIHRGLPPAKAPRLLLTIQYALLPCLLYDYQPVLTHHFNFSSYINRLIIKPSSK